MSKKMCHTRKDKSIECSLDIMNCDRCKKHYDGGCEGFVPEGEECEYFEEL